MLTRDDVLSRAADDCMKKLYSLVQPSVDWNEFIKENKIYSDRYRFWERFYHLHHKKDKSKKELEEYSTFPVHNWEGKSITECIGPRPYEFYYLPREIMKDICDDYVRVYKMDSQQELLNTIEILKDYCKKPIVDKYIKGKDGEPGYRGYDHPDNLEKELYKLLREKAGFSVLDSAVERLSKEVLDKFFEFLDMAGNFYCWNRDLNAFNTTVYLGCSPSSNKEAVIKNWKEYRNQDIEIDEEKIKREFYGEDYDE